MKNRKVFEEKYKMLNPEQKKAVDTLDGPVVVVAGPGTGKTQILTLRIANILDKLGGELAENILALTFTNSGVLAMRERLSDFVGTETAYKVNIFTFHSFAEEQIRNNPEYFPNFAFSNPITDIEKIEIIEDVLSKTKLEKLKTFASDFHYTRKIIAAINDLKNEAISPEGFELKIKDQEKEILADESSYYKRNTATAKKGDLKPDALKPIGQNKELVKVYAAYQEALKQKHLYDFSDMVLSVVGEAESNLEYRSLLQEKYHYLLVDEHQDTNNAQNRMVELIGAAEVNEGRPNIFTVGDEKQAIYAFQGASIENFLKFKNLYKDVEVVGLSQNYRSSQNILDSAHSLLAGDIKLEAGNNDFAKIEHKVNLFELGDYKSELLFLAESVKEKISEGVDPNEIAVFYKENKNLAEIKNIFEKLGVPYKVFSKENILDNKEIKKLVWYLRAIENPYNDEFLAKLMFIDFVGLDTFDVLKILEKLNKRGKGESKNKTLYGLISNEELLKGVGVEDVFGIVAFAENLKKLKEFSLEYDFLEFFEKFIHESGFLKYILQSNDSAPALKRLEKIFDEAKKQFFSKKDYSLVDFIAYVDILEKYGLSIDLGVDTLIDGVNLMTAHGSKGLEFEYVYITNFVDSQWGGKRRMGSFKLPVAKAEGGVDDQRRLFYVALTRGKKQVNITYSNFDLDGREKKVSRFLDEMDEGLVEKKDVPTDSMEEKMEKYFGQKQERVLSIFDKDYVRKLFLKNSLSVSALNNYQSSPLKYFFRNLIRIPSSQTKPLIFGNIVHESLDKFFAKSKKEGSLLSEKDLKEIFNETLENSNVLEKYYDDIKSHGESVLLEYFENYKNDFSLDIETEKKAFAEMDLRSGEKLRLYGILDKAEKMDGGKIRVVDYKTGKAYSAKTKDQKADLDRQLVFYKFLMDKYFDENRVEEGVLDFLEKNKKGEYERVVKNIDGSDVEVLEKEILDFADDILSGDFMDREYERDADNEEYFDLWEMIKK